MNLKGLNKVDVDYIREWFEGLVVKYFLDQAEIFLVRHSIARIFANEFREQGRRRLEDGWFDPTPSNAEASHIVDWLRADLQAGAPWLENLDERGRPRKLLKCRSIDDLMREADKAMDRRNAQQAKALGPDDESFVADLGGGYTLVRMLTPEALDLESSRMHHCVGHGAYDARQREGWGRYLSVRDKKGRPVATIELQCEPNEEWLINQLQGKRNTRPAREVMDVLHAYAVEQDWRERHFWWPSVITVDGSEFDVDRIPAGVTIRHLDIHVGMLAIYPGLELPAGLTALGHAYLPPGIKLPEDMTLNGVLEFTRRIDGDPLIVLPDSLVANEIRVGAREDLAQPIPEHLPPRIRYRIQKLTGHTYSDCNDEPAAFRP